MLLILLAPTKPPLPENLRGQTPGVFGGGTRSDPPDHRAESSGLSLRATIRHSAIPVSDEKEVSTFLSAAMDEHSQLPYNVQQAFDASP